MCGIDMGEVVSGVCCGMLGVCHEGEGLVVKTGIGCVG